METTLTFEKILELFAESDKRFNERLEKERAEQEKERAEQEKVREKERAEQEKERIKHREEWNRDMKELNRKIADLTDTMGEFAEEQVKPNIINLFVERGILIKEYAEHVKLKDDNGKLLAEIDLFLGNTEYAIAVEVKQTLRHKDIDEHLERLEIIVQKATNFTKRWNTLLGAVAGMISSESVEQYAIKNGLFVIRPSGDSVCIANELGFKFREWK